MADDNKDKYITEQERVIPPVLKSDPDSVFKKGNKVASNFEIGELTPAILESSHAAYKAAAENATDKDIVFLNTNKIKESGFPSLYIETSKQITGHNKDLTQTAKRIASLNSDNRDPESIINNINEQIKDIIDAGPAATQVADSCLINLPEEKMSEDDNNHLQYNYPNSIISLPLVMEKDLLILAGAHEGEHCNQDYIETDENDPLSYLKSRILEETLSDRHAFDVLRDQGKNDTIEYWKQFRTVTAIQDKEHATGIFLDSENNPTEINNEQALAAASFDLVAALAISKRLNIELIDSIKMTKEYPKEFNTILKEEMDKGNLQTGEMVYIEPKSIAQKDFSLICVSAYQKKNMIEQMGITDKEFDNLDEKRIPDIVNAYQSLQENGTFPKENKYVEKYITQHINGIDKVIGGNKEPYKPYPQINTASERDLKQEAFNNIYSIMSKAVAQTLGISEADADKLNSSRLISDNQKYLNALEAAMKNGTIDTMTMGTASDLERDKIVARRIGIPENKINPYSLIHSKVKDILMRGDAFNLPPTENPHVLPFMQDRIKLLKENLEFFGTLEKTSSIGIIKENFAPQDNQGRKYAVNVTPQYSSAPTV